MFHASVMAPTGTLRTQVIRRSQSAPLSWKVRNLPNHLRALPGLAVARVANWFGIGTIEAALYGIKYCADGRVINYGCLSRRVVTDNGVAFIVDALKGGAVTIANMKYHGYGTGTDAEAAADAALGTEFTTEYAADNTRPTGSQGEGSTANIYQTVATFSPDSGGTLAVTEHGIFDQASNAGGVLLDRSKFAAVNLVAAADSFVTTYELTLTAGS